MQAGAAHVGAQHGVLTGPPALCPRLLLRQAASSMPCQANHVRSSVLGYDGGPAAAGRPRLILGAVWTQADATLYSLCTGPRDTTLRGTVDLSLAHKAQRQVLHRHRRLQRPALCTARWRILAP